MSSSRTGRQRICPRLSEGHTHTLEPVLRGKTSVAHEDQQQAIAEVWPEIEAWLRRRRGVLSVDRTEVEEEFGFVVGRRLPNCTERIAEPPSPATEARGADSLPSAELFDRVTIPIVSHHQPGQYFPATPQPTCPRAPLPSPLFLRFQVRELLWTSCAQQQEHRELPVTGNEHPCRNQTTTSSVRHAAGRSYFQSA